MNHDEIFILYFSHERYYDDVSYINNKLAEGWRIKSSTPLADENGFNPHTGIDGKFSRILFILEPA